MSVAANLLWVALWLALVLVAAKTARRIWPLQQELSRKLVHIGAGLAVPLAWLLQIPRQWALPAAGLATLIALINHRFRLVPEVEDVGRRSVGTIAYRSARDAAFEAGEPSGVPIYLARAEGNAFRVLTRL